MNNDFYSSNIDDDMFEDSPSGIPAQVSQTDPNPNNGVMQTPGVSLFNQTDPQQQQQQVQSQQTDPNAIGVVLNEDLQKNGIGGTITSGTGNGNTTDIIAAILKKDGIDPNNIAFTDENGNPEYTTFNDLSDSEKIDILTSVLAKNNPQDNQGDDLDDDEIDFINSVRRSKMSVEDFVSSIKQQAVNEYLNSISGQEEYSVDDLNDDQLYIYNYKQLVPNATEEQAAEALKLAKANEEVFKTTMEGMRNTYKTQEQQIHQQQIAENEERIKRQQAEYENIVVDTIDNMSNFGLGELQISLSNQDKEDIASAILDSDVSGKRYLSQMLNDPETLAKMVWYALKGDEAVEQMQRYYNKTIVDKQSAAYKKGFEDAKNGKGMSYVVQKPKGSNPKSQFRTIERLEDIDAELD